MQAGKAVGVASGPAMGPALTPSPATITTSVAVAGGTGEFEVECLAANALVHVEESGHPRVDRKGDGRADPPADADDDQKGPADGDGLAGQVVDGAVPTER